MFGKEGKPSNLARRRNNLIRFIIRLKNTNQRKKEHLPTSIDTFPDSQGQGLTKTDIDETGNPIILLRKGVLGQSFTIQTPFGQRQLVYADYTASGRFLIQIENFFTEKIAPLYANTHTEASATGAQTTVLREEARSIVAQSVNAPPKKYVTLFTGTGCTGALEKMIKVLGIMLPKYADIRWKLSTYIPEIERPVVFIGPFEHHSNELPWRESIATVVVIPEDKDGCPDIQILEHELAVYKDRRIKIGSFSACSNVTGICIDTKKMTLLLHKHNALAFFDFAGSGAYTSVDMNGSSEEESMDAIFMSPHKFIGGPGCTGVLVAKRVLFTGIDGIENRSPTFPGGGTVAFVGPYAQDYEEAIEAREDAGTPGIVQAIRTGLAFRVKEIVGSDKVEVMARFYCTMVFNLLRDEMNISLVGCDRLAYFDSTRRIPIFSFNVLTPFQSKFEFASNLEVQTSSQEQEMRNMRPTMQNMSGKDVEMKVTSMTQTVQPTANNNLMLHPCFVVSILNDIYGIQARAGCSCTGPYGHRLFNIAENNNMVSNALRKLIKQNYHAFKPGWARVNFNYFISEEEVKFICDAIVQIGKFGWILLPFYEQELSSGLYVHRGKKDRDDQMDLKSPMIFLRDLNLSIIQSKSSLKSSIPPQRTSNDFYRVLKDAQIIYEAAENKLRSLLTSVKNTGDIEIDTFTEPVPADVELDKVWWATSQDVIKHLKEGYVCGPSSSVRDTVDVPSSIVGIDDVRAFIYCSIDDHN